MSAKKGMKQARSENRKQTNDGHKLETKRERGVKTTRKVPNRQEVKTGKNK